MTKITKTDTAITEATTFAVPDDYDLGIQSEDVKMPSILLWQKMSDMVGKMQGKMSQKLKDPKTSEKFNKIFDITN